MKQLLIVVLMACYMPLFAGTKIYIGGHLPGARKNDSVNVIVLRYSENLMRLNEVHQLPLKDGSFELKVDTDVPFAYIHLGYTDPVSRGTTASIPLLVEPGDSIQIELLNGTFHFTGRGAKKIQLQQEISMMCKEKVRKFSHNYNMSKYYYDPLTVMQNFMWQDSLADRQMALLNAHRSEFGTRIFNMLKADVCIMNLDEKWANFPNHDNDSVVSALEGYHDRYYDELLAAGAAPGSDMLYSLGYYYAVYCKFCFDNFLSIRNAIFCRPIYYFIKTHFQGALREKMLTSLLYERRNSAEDLTPMVIEAGTMVNNPSFKALLKDIGAGLHGMPAYNFSLQDTTGKVWRLTDFRDKVVIIDFWYNGCGACRYLYEKMKPIEEKYREDKKVQFMTMILPSPRQVWLDGINGGTYTSRETLNLWLDPADGKDDDHPVMHNYRVGGFPTLIMIDKEGKLMTAPVSPVADNGVDLLAKVEKEKAR